MKFDFRLPMYFRVTAVFFAVGAVWGSAWIPAAMLSQTLPGLAGGALRFGLAAVALGAAAGGARLRTPANLRRPVTRLLGPSIVLGVTMLGLPYALTVWAAGRVSPGYVSSSHVPGGVVALCFGFMPLLVLLVENDNQGAERRRSAIPAVVLGIGGVAMAVAPGLSFRWQEAGGVAALLAAVSLGGFSLVYVRRLDASGRLKSGDLLSFPAIQLGVASVLLAVLLSGTGPRTTFHWEKTAALPLAILAIIVSGGTLPLLYWLLGRITAWQAATLQWVATLVAVAEGALMAGAKLGLEAWIGAALIPACILSIFLGGYGEGLAPVTPEITMRPFGKSNASDYPGDSG
jgi:drug/metabolite transporter (DMT)-like permease